MMNREPMNFCLEWEMKMNANTNAQIRYVYRICSWFFCNIVYVLCVNIMNLNGYRFEWRTIEKHAVCCVLRIICWYFIGVSKAMLMLFNWTFIIYQIQLCVCKRCLYNLWIMIAFLIVIVIAPVCVYYVSRNLKGNVTYTDTRTQKYINRLHNPFLTTIIAFFSFKIVFGKRAV